MLKGELPSLSEILEIINTKLRDRKQLANLYEYFLSANFDVVLKNDMQLGQINIQTLFFFLSQFLEIKNIKQKEAVYYEGNRSEFIYILLQGGITTYKLSISRAVMTPLEYYASLKGVHDEGGKYLLEKTIILNSDVYPVNKSTDVLMCLVWRTLHLK